MVYSSQSYAFIFVPTLLDITVILSPFKGQGFLVTNTNDSLNSWSH